MRAAFVHHLADDVGQMQASDWLTALFNDMHRALIGRFPGEQLVLLGKKNRHSLCILHKVRKMFYFFKRLSTSLSSLLSISELEHALLKIVQLKSRHYPEW